MHGIDQYKAILDTTFGHNALNILCNTSYFIPFIGIHPKFFDIGCCLAGDEFAHAPTQVLAVVDYFSGLNKEELSSP